MNRFTLLPGLALLLAVALGLVATAWMRTRQESDAIRAANESVRKTLGEMTVALAEKDKEIDRLSGAPCGKNSKASMKSNGKGRI